MIQSDKTKVGETKGKGVSGLNSIRDKTQLPTIAFKTFFVNEVQTTQLQ